MEAAITATDDVTPATVFIALELSRSTWLVAVHSPVADKVSLHRLDGGDTNGLLALVARKRGQAEEALGYDNEFRPSSADEFRPTCR